MKLEAIDPLNLGNICVATICKVSLGALRPPAAFPMGRAVAERPLLVAPEWPGFQAHRLSSWLGICFLVGGRRLANPVGWPRRVSRHQAGRLAESLASHP